MSEIFYSSAVFLLLSILANTNAQRVALGGCPSVKPMSGFNMQDFLGIWYGVPASTCIIYNITLGGVPGQYKVQELSRQFTLGSSSVLWVETSQTGTMTVADGDVPARMRVKYEWDEDDITSLFVVFMSDFKTYAGVFTCQERGSTHKRTATLLSRKRIHGKTFIDKMSTRLAAYGVDLFDLTLTKQEDCATGRPGNVDVVLDEYPYTTEDDSIAIEPMITEHMEDDDNQIQPMITEHSMENDVEWIRV